MWRVARLRLYDAYVGTPDPLGPAETTYTYELAGALLDGRSAPVPVRSLGGFGIALAFAAGLLLLFVAALQWAHA
jgi:hypothetical protein